MNEMQKIKVRVFYKDDSELDIICQDPHKIPDLCDEIMKAIKINEGLLSIGDQNNRVLVNFDHVKHISFDLCA